MTQQAGGTSASNSGCNYPGPVCGWRQTRLFHLLLVLQATPEPSLTAAVRLMAPSISTSGSDTMWEAIEGPTQAFVQRYLVDYLAQLGLVAAGSASNVEFHL